MVYSFSNSITKIVIIIAGRCEQFDNLWYSNSITKIVIIIAGRCVSSLMIYGIIVFQIQLLKSI